jgi:hypothetical protein
MKILQYPQIYTRQRYRILFKGFIEDLYGNPHGKSALVSYVTKPFTHKRLQGHPNIAESQVITKLFDRLGYNVDVVDYFSDTPLRYEKYDVIFGFGAPFESSFATAAEPLRIYYGTTCQASFNNDAELRRIREIRARKGLWLRPRRLLEQSWSRSTALADALIILGNSHTAGTYEHYSGQQVFSFDATALLPPVANPVGKNMESRRNTFLWLGSTTGGVHKGLDLCLECFAANPEVTLHLCGCLEDEIACAYRDELSHPNIVAHDFVAVQSPVFGDILRSCAFAILPTCSEGQSTSLLTVMGQGLIPVTSVAAGIDIEGLGFLIDELTTTGVSRAVEKARHTPSRELEQMARKNVERILNRHTLERFEHRLESILRHLLRQRG